MMNSKHDFTGQVALITGATTELGRQAALAYAEAGASLALVAEETEALYAFRDELERAGHHALALTCRLTDETEVRTAVKAALRAYGKIDVLFNNSGLALREGLAELTDREWGRAFGEALISVYLASKYVIPSMKHGGRIVNISSTGARPAAKEGQWSISFTDKVSNLTRFLARLYSSYGITINTLAPERMLGTELGVAGAILALSDPETTDSGSFVGVHSAATA
jgi:gluconate 5-dehydrogenase